MTPFSAVELDGLMMIALAPAEIRLRMSAVCSAAPPLRFASLTDLTTLLAVACALTAQIISSRQPLPTSVLDTPRMNGPAAPRVGFAEAVVARAAIVTAKTSSSATRPLRRTPRVPDPILIDLLLFELPGTGPRRKRAEAYAICLLSSRGFSAFPADPRKVRASRRACSA